MFKTGVCIYIHTCVMPDSEMYFVEMIVKQPYEISSDG